MDGMARKAEKNAERLAGATGFDIDERSTERAGNRINWEYAAAQ
ncbi:unnamed protein product [Caenorhabditis auriculariae]|uniref:Uncharacterized protein n=1 Tax=Caenorhabditis auriculariae TaxID=2777116 RepID=A0A8S1GUF6_9PELO|nr:unnamed protein product [Caenorhabditis auriculariae]